MQRETNVRQQRERRGGDKEEPLACTLNGILKERSQNSTTRRGGLGEIHKLWTALNGIRPLLHPLPARASAMKLVNAESRATGSGIFVAGAFPPVEQESRGSSLHYCQEGPSGASSTPDEFSSPRENCESRNLRRGFADLDDAPCISASFPFCEFYLAFKASLLRLAFVGIIQLRLSCRIAFVISFPFCVID